MKEKNTTFAHASDLVGWAAGCLMLVPASGGRASSITNMYKRADTQALGYRLAERRALRCAALQRDNCYLPRRAQCNYWTRGRREGREGCNKVSARREAVCSLAANHGPLCYGLTFVSGLAGGLGVREIITSCRSRPCDMQRRQRLWPGAEHVSDRECYQNIPRLYG